MMEPFVGKPFWTTLGALAAVFVLAMLAFSEAFVWPVLILVMIGTVILTWHRLEWGIAAAFAELFANSHGHLVDADLGGFSFSLRMAVFVSVMGVYGLRLLFRQSPLPLWKDARLPPFLLLFAAVIIGFFIGVRDHPIRNAFDDANGYLYVLYIFPVLSVSWTATTRRLMLQVLCASAVWVSLISLALLFIFTHLPVEALAATYTFIRDTRTGELTRMGAGIFRIFLQAQFSVAVAWLALAAWGWTQKEMVWFSRSWLALSTLFLATLLISLSRSFWIGLVAALLAVLTHALAHRIPRPLFVLRKIGVGIGSALIGFFLLVGIVVFPFPKSTVDWDDLGSLLSSRATDLDDVSISSRWNLLPPLFTENLESPILGKGFGEEVTFQTDDPRARALSPDGTWTTYAFEWGWLDIWLKMGLFGLAAFGWILVRLWKGMAEHLRGKEPWVGMFGLMALVFVYVAHAFSPYLNHPLGLGLLLFLLPFWKQKTPAARLVEASESVRRPLAQPSVAPLISE